MAKKRSNKPPKDIKKWKAAPEDAIRLAALRWFALQLEASAIVLYATNQKTYDEMEAILRSAMDGMNGLKRTYGLGEEDPEPCPDGFIRCKDGTCAPACDGIIASLPRVK